MVFTLLTFNKLRLCLNDAVKAMRDIVANGGRVLFVGTKRQASDKIAESAKRCGQYYVNHRWLGGMMTNWNTISKSIQRFRDLDDFWVMMRSVRSHKERAFDADT